ncbi:Male sterility protein [Amycolatopsis arida]|uniref:Male sterility protein n=1 Tax=Amycolatopsis arida TaxID=587909 RepID=A0A1I5UXS9_9PSEU|nr:SDR family oxidoreductase [Amycolatopsis arida]TDX91073.1 male sterility protein [Amycolatopsis arida]SFQ00030.1 Male sterility protein [Amycolatopsis arida]
MAEPGVALTGATGFLGAHLVRELLRRHRTLTVLARGDSASVLDRIGRFLRLAGASAELLDELPGRVRPVRTDLTRPRLGLSATAFRELADELDVLWHCAGDVTLGGDLAELRRVNVGGTRQMLDLAAAGRRQPLLHHVSTAFVAGAHRYGTIREDFLDDSAGFENHYERSKFEAEVLVRRWAAEHGRPVVVFRPSVLVTDLPRCADLPRHTVGLVGELVEKHLRQFGLADHWPPEHLRPVVRIVGDSTAHLNLLPVDTAASVMARLAEHPPSGGVDTFHIVHRWDTLIADLLAVLERIAPVRPRLVSGVPPDETSLEAAVRYYSAFGSYARQHRRFDDSRVRALLGNSTHCPRLDRNYLHATIRRAAASAARA